jgi:hypothetical protein
MADTQVENEFTNRVETKLSAASPGFDPAMITTLIDTLMELVSGFCGDKNATPEQAVENVSRLSTFQRAALRARLKRNARERGVKDARKLADITADAVETVAKEATPQERVAFAAYLKPMSDDEFSMI